MENRSSTLPCFVVPSGAIITSGYLLEHRSSIDWCPPHRGIRTHGSMWLVGRDMQRVYSEPFLLLLTASIN